MDNQNAFEVENLSASVSRNELDVHTGYKRLGNVVIEEKCSITFTLSQLLFRSLPSDILRARLAARKYCDIEWQNVIFLDNVGQVFGRYFEYGDEQVFNIELISTHLEERNIVAS